MPLKSFTLENEALRVFDAASRRERANLLSAFESLCANPGQGFDSTLRDEIGRGLRCMQCGRFAVFWWEDFADRRLRIVSLKELA